ncbi:MAG TPA: glutathione S-transferase family protein [Beijerinckiaceae bacterium]|jgi:glutathione S-transferase
MRKLLFSNGSPYARRVRVVLIEKGLAFEPDVNDAVRPIEEIRPHNPALQVPVLYDGDRHLFGSNLIIEYLFETYPTPTRAPGVIPLAPSIVRPDRVWDDKLVLTAIEALADALVNVRLMTGADEESVPFMARQRRRIASCLDWLEPRIEADGEGFWPGTFSVMDLNLMCPLLYGEKRGTFAFRTGQWPRVTAMVNRWQSRPSVAATPVNEWPPKAA